MQNGNVLTQSSVLLALHLGRLGNTRRVDPNAVEVDADRDMVHVSKVLVDAPEYRVIATFDHQVRTHIYQRSLPIMTLKAGIYRLPVDLVQELDDELVAFQSQREELIDKFMEVYTDHINRVETRLRALFKSSDYPSSQAARLAFIMEWRYFVTDVPEVLSHLSKNILNRERRKAAAAVQTEVGEIRAALRNGFAELLDHAVDRLGYAEGGKKKMFRDSLYENLATFFKYFNQRNIVGDRELQEIVDQARNVLGLVGSAEDLRTDDGIRERARVAFVNFRKVMTERGMITRQITLEEDKDVRVP